MYEDELLEVTSRAIEIADAAWRKAHEGRPSNPMARAAAIPATGILAAAVMGRVAQGEPAIDARVETAIRVARRAWEKTRREPPGNPIAATAEKSVIGILAAGILNYQSSADCEPEEVEFGT